jgi:hypothetical protein
LLAEELAAGEELRDERAEGDAPEPLRGELVVAAKSDEVVSVWRPVRADAVGPSFPDRH